MASSLPNSGDETLAFDRVGRVTLPLPDGAGTLALFWMRGYTGGLFLPFRDATSGEETYGAGRYVLDTGKGADLGERPGRPARSSSTSTSRSSRRAPSTPSGPARWRRPRTGSRRAIEAGERLR